MKDGFFAVNSYASGAVFSSNRAYRYVLWRMWRSIGDYAAFIGLNPSKADEVDNDPTVKRCIAFAKAWGLSGIFMLNIFAFKATDPDEMMATASPIGRKNDEMLLRYCRKSKIIVACWGTHGAYRNRGDDVAKRVLKGQTIYCLGTTKNGFPKHPLYLAKTAGLEPYKGRQ